eukprot:SAG11_NODE_353_length_10348_cov_6.938335_4_plen_82_part_00
MAFPELYFEELRDFPVSHKISARRSGQKNASILKLRNFCDQFWNLQLKSYPGLYRVLLFKSTVIWADTSNSSNPVPVGTLQ